MKCIRDFFVIIGYKSLFFTYLLIFVINSVSPSAPLGKELQMVDADTRSVTVYASHNILSQFNRCVKKAQSNVIECRQRKVMISASLVHLL